MKKLVVFTLAIVLVSSLILAACAAPAPAPAPSPTPAPAPAPAPGPTPEKPLELNFSYHAPPQASLTKAILEPWAKDLEAATNGRVKIVHHAGGSLLGAADAYDGVISGICDLAQISTEEYPGRFPRSGISSLPFLYPGTEVAGIVYHELMNKYALDNELKEVKLLITLPLHPAHYLGNKQIQKLADFQGVKMRAPGKVVTSTVKALGGTPVEVSTPDIFSALDTKLIDGTFFTFSGALAFGIKDVTKFRTECAIYLDTFQLVMNKDVYNKLPADLKKVFDDFSTPAVSRKYGAAHAALEQGGRGAILGSDKKAGNPPIYVLPKEERDKWAQATQSVKDEWVADMQKDGIPGKQMLDDAINLVNKYSQP